MPTDDSWPDCEDSPMPVDYEAEDARAEDSRLTQLVSDLTGQLVRERAAHREDMALCDRLSGELARRTIELRQAEGERRTALHERDTARDLYEQVAAERDAALRERDESEKTIDFVCEARDEFMCRAEKAERERDAATQRAEAAEARVKRLEVENAGARYWVKEGDRAIENLRAHAESAEAALRVAREALAPVLADKGGTTHWRMLDAIKTAAAALAPKEGAP